MFYNRNNYMKKIFPLLIIFIIFIIFTPIISHADMGPKPSVVIDFSGLEEQKYFVTLLSEKSSNGPYSVFTDEYPGYYQESDPNYDIFLKFTEFKDDYYFIQFFHECTDINTFNWTYYPPEKFKILIYLPEKDEFILSEIYEKYAFDSYFTANIENMSFTGINKSYDYFNEYFALVSRILITILIELLILFLFRFKEKKQIIFIIIINIATQILLNILLNNILYSSGKMAFDFYYILFEIIITIIEMTAYSIYFKKCSKNPYPLWKPPVYALTANIASFIAGFGIAFILPNIF